MRSLKLIPLALFLACSGTKTEQGLAGSNGEDGATGTDGEAGAAGEDGEDGDPGTDGEDGAPGTEGEDGEDGRPGTDGADGADGTEGADGEDGLACWDLDGDGEPDPEEDINGDGVVDVWDCRGDPGEDPGGDTGEGEPEESLGVYLGHLDLTSEMEAAYFCEHYDRVYGDLYVDYVADDLSALSCLVEVSQDLTIAADHSTSISLPSLQTVGESFHLMGPEVEEADFLALETVGHFLQIESVGRDAISPSLTFPSLHTIGQNLVVMYIGASTVDFSSLTSAGDILVHECERLENLDGFSALSEVTPGELRITNNDVLVDVTGLMSVTYILAGLEFSNNPMLPTSMAEEVAAAIPFIGGGTAIYGNGSG